MNRMHIWIIAMALARCAAAGAASDAEPPPNPVMIAFEAGRIEQGRREAAVRLAKAAAELAPDAAATPLDRSTKRRGDAYATYLDQVSAWAKAEAVVLHRTGKADEQFVQAAWKPLFDAAKPGITRLDLLLKQCETRPVDDPFWRTAISRWRDARMASLERLALLAKMAGRPDLVRAVFDFAAPVGEYRTAEQFIQQPQEAASVFNEGLLVQAIAPAEEIAIRTLLAEWVAAVESKRREAFVALHEDSASAERQLQDGLFTNYGYRDADPRSARITATRIDKGVFAVLWDCPAKTPTGERTGQFRRFTVVAKNGKWVIRLPAPSGLTEAEKGKVRGLVEAWFNAVLAKDSERALRLYRDPGQARGEVEQAIRDSGQVSQVDLKHADYVFRLGRDGRRTVSVDRFIAFGKDGIRRPAGREFGLSITGDEVKLDQMPKEIK